jgi:uncharacterized protein YwqG
MSNRDALCQRLIDNGLDRVATELADLAAPCIMIATTPAAAEEAIPIGHSKFGGCPDLPANFAWPQWQGLPLAFLGQINLAEVQNTNPVELLPASGILSCFYDPEQSTWGFDPEDRGSWSVCWFPHQDLQRMPPPDDLSEDGEFPACELSFAAELTLLGLETAEIALLNLTAEEQEHYLECIDFPEGYGHHLLGYPQEIQGSMQLECQLASHGIYCGDSQGQNQTQVQELAATASDWILLLQIDTDDNVNWMWGDCGRLYFWIKQADLVAQKFDAVWMILQCC